MKRTKISWALARTAALCLGAALPCFAQDAAPSFVRDLDWKASTSLNYDSGDFGTGVRSSSLYIPATLKSTFGDWSVSLTIPYLSQTTDGRVTNVGGRPVRVSGARSAAAATTAATTHSGLGDVVLRGGYVVLSEPSGSFDLALAAKIKFPTADKDKGLGTGEFDEGVGVEFGKLLSPGWTALADAYFTTIGDPPGADLRNQAALDIGLAHVLSEKTTVSAYLEGSNALVPGQPAPLALRAVLDYKVSAQAGFFAGVLAGLSDGSPDYGVSLGGSLRF